MAQIFGKNIPWQLKYLPPTFTSTNVTNIECPFKSGCENICPMGTQTGAIQDSGSNFVHDKVDCLSLNPDVCNVGGVSAISTKWSTSGYQQPGSPVGGNDTNAKQDCIYNPKDFKTYDQVLAFQNAYSSNTDFKSNFDEIMKNFCALSSSNCSNSLFGQNLTCSNLRDTTEIGDFCRNWFNSTTDENRDIVGQNYCAKYNTEECQCLNCLKNPIYKDTSVSSPYQDCCWWLPCKNPSDYFVPKEQIPCPSCPTTVCDAIVQAYDSKNVDIPNITQYINCPGIQNGNGPSPSSPPITLYAVISVLIVTIIFIVPPFRLYILGHILLTVTLVIILFSLGGIYLYFDTIKQYFYKKNKN